MGKLHTVGSIVLELLGAPKPKDGRPGLGDADCPPNHTRLVAGVGVATIALAFVGGWSMPGYFRARRARINYQRAGMPPLPPGQTQEEWVERWSRPKRGD